MDLFEHEPLAQDFQVDQSRTTDSGHSEYADTINSDDFGRAFQRGFYLTQSYLTSSGASTEMASECAQAAWARGWERRAQIRDPKAITQWVTSIAKNMFRSHLRSARPTEPINPELCCLTDSREMDTVDVKTLLSKCANTDRFVLVSHYIEGYTLSEIGCQVGLSAKAVRSRLHRIRCELRSSLAESRQDGGKAPRMRDQHSDCALAPAFTDRSDRAACPTQAVATNTPAYT